MTNRRSEGDRWRIELSLRSLKITQGMDVLRCRAPEMVHKELALHEFAYNLIRLLMREAAPGQAVDPHRLFNSAVRRRVNRVRLRQAAPAEAWSEDEGPEEIGMMSPDYAGL
jgi:hypothetical protein